MQVMQIPDVDNSAISNIKDLPANFKLTGTKIGRVNLVAKSTYGHTKNIWVNVVNNENAKSSSKIANGNGFTIALKADGTVWAFGNINGKNSPEKIEVPEQVIDINAGESQVLLLGITGNVYSFGQNKFGELGTGNTVNSKTPVKLGITKITKVIANHNTSFAINEEGKVYAWGEGYTKVPKLLEKDNNIIDIGRKYYLADDGKVRSILDDREIMLSYNEYENVEEPEFIDEKIVQMSEGINHILLLGSSGNVYSYGENTYGQLGDGTTIRRDENITTVVRVKQGDINQNVTNNSSMQKLENITEISAGDKYSLAATNTGNVYIWGNNEHQTLGFSNEISEGGIEKTLYAVLKQDISDIERVNAGYAHTSTYKKDGAVFTWGKGEER